MTSHGMSWRCGAHELALDAPLVMAIVNVTPDSFSDGGTHADAQAALDFARRCLADGADILDVGGESTRPGAEPVAEETELARVLPVVEALAASGACVSVDTRRASVARACLAAGASIINDVSGFRDPDLVAVVAASGCGVVTMHMLGEPGTMQDDPRYDDVVAQVRDELARSVERLTSAGVERERITVDPGIGFGKTLAHNLALLQHLDALAGLGLPVVVGASRKRFIGAITGIEDPASRDAGSIGAAVAAMLRGASVLRVHDVAGTVAALRVAHAIDTGAVTR